MTTLYKPVLIETAEQAEALDWKTPIHIVLARTREVHDVRLFEDFVEDFWPDALEPDNRWAYVALVPVEAEYEWTCGTVAPAWSPGTESWAREFQAQMPGRRLFRHLVLPWEEA